MRISHSIDIAASPDAVWQLTVDVERWPEWTPTISSVQLEGPGPLALGSAAMIRQPAQPPSRWVVTHFDSGRSFSWESRRKGLHFIGTHEVLPSAAGSTSRLQLEAKGLLAYLLWPLLGPAVRQALAAENRGMKQKAEQLAATGSPPVPLRPAA